jgi:hypothetical protein
MRAALAAVVALLVIPAAASKQPPSYRVTVAATLQERAVYSLTGDAACFWSARGIAVRHLEIASVAPVLVSPAQLERGVGVPLEVHEIRLANHNNVTGACTRLGPQISDPDNLCGKRTYRVPASAVRLRLVGGMLTFSIVRVAADPYSNRCAPSMWGAVPESGHRQLVATWRFPPKPSSAPFDQQKLVWGKQLMTGWSGTVSTANATLGRSDVSSASWRVALTFG